MAEAPASAATHAGRLFDAYVFVDWSGRAAPSPRVESADAIWVGELVRAAPGGTFAAGTQTGTDTDTDKYFSTRLAAGAHLEGRLVAHVRLGRRVLVGFDLPYGYPAGFAACLGARPPEPAWSFVWQTIASLVRDAPDNHNNRFEVAAALNERVRGLHVPGPFWGAPVGTAIRSLSRFRPPFPFATGSGTELAALRAGERRLRVQEAWKLYGAGSVGSQALLGLPWLARLRWHPELAAVSRVWPFETGFACPVPAGAFVLHVEIWPGIVDAAVRAAATGIRDRDQVRAMARWAAEHDAAGGLATYLGRPRELDDHQLRVCVAEEGWVFGLHPTTVERTRPPTRGQPPEGRPRNRPGRPTRSGGGDVGMSLSRWS